ncbi:alpha/beta fold hydrolase [Paenibacillus mendelii]|uniref:Alpha/beta fold hydrolase n=1 Tax=Paenibacillus mendelii TaxID=206163 RepID=A0ABV6J6D1_9BACL|nr:alpha/beta hydrolase [Paenibacillus mendelii]MCQ6561181.1 alpha/beta hydrolase [Paenibacillus mendelii]
MKPIQEQGQEKIGIVFVHGAGLTNGIWSGVVEGLDRPYLLGGYPLLSGQDLSRQGLTMDDYVTDMKRQIEQWPVKRFVIVAHSIGGVLAQRLAEELPDRLAGFVGVGAAIPKKGGSFLSTLPWPKRMLMSAILQRMGTKPPDSAIRAGLCNDLTASQAEEIVRGFIPESIHIYTDRIGAALPEVPKLYVKLTKDKEFGQSHQYKMIGNLSPQTVESLETGHLPMLSDPKGLRNILQSFAAKLDE